MAKDIRWLDWNESFTEETRNRISIDPDKLCEYGVKALDDALFKIGPNELVVIGAETGHGKSDLGLSIARHNVKKDRSVGIYYLEGGYDEAIKRIKWREITKRYYDEYSYLKVDIDFKRWVYNNIKHSIIEEIESQVYNDYQKYKDKLFFYNAGKDFTVEKFIGSLNEFAEPLSTNLGLDLLIIDHLQYFSLTNVENEIAEITRIIRTVKELTEYYNVPVILISHLRKRGRKAFLPTHEDFYGSGNIAKISTTAIMISPAVDRKNLSSDTYPTYLRVVKSRTGVRPNYAILVDYNLNTRTYEDSYEIYRINQYNEVLESPLLKEELPKWAKGGSDDSRIKRKD